jgi:hypothetical protein
LRRRTSLPRLTDYRGCTLHGTGLMAARVVDQCFDNHSEEEEMLDSRWTVRLLAILAAGILFACGDDDGDDGQLFPDASVATATVRVVHASPDAPAVDIYAAGTDTPLIEGLAYGETSPPLQVAPGTYQFDIRPAGAAPGSAPVFTTGDLVVPANVEITAVAAGLLNGTGDQAFRVLAFADEFEQPGAGQAVVRVIHASPDAPAVSLDVGRNDDLDVTDLERYQASESLLVPAGQELPIDIFAGEPATLVTAFTTPALAEGAQLYVIATGLVAEEPRSDSAFALLVIDQSGSIGITPQNPVVYALHASPDAPPVDILVGEAVLVQNLAFSELSGPIQVAPGTYQLDFFATGTTPTTPAASVTTPRVEAGQQYLLIATGFLTPEANEAGFQLIAVRENLPMDAAGQAVFEVVHASPDAPVVDVAEAGSGPLKLPILVEDLAFGQISAEAVEIPPATIEIGLAPAGSTDPIAIWAVTATPGMRAFLVVAGAATPAADEEGLVLIQVIVSTRPWTAVLPPQVPVD